MRYFPLFFDSTDKKILIVGGGEAAYAKLTVLDDFSFAITIVAKSVLPKLRHAFAQRCEIRVKPFAVEDADGFDIIIAATDDETVQNDIFTHFRETKLVNCVDSPERCTFIFGSMFSKEGVTVAVNSQSHAPSVSKALKERLRAAIPDGLSELIAHIIEVRRSEKKGERRMQKIIHLTKEWFLHH